MIKLESLINSIATGLALIVTVNCLSSKNFETIYVNPSRPFSVIYGTFKSNNLQQQQSTNLVNSIVECQLIEHPSIVEKVSKLSSDQLKRLIVTLDDVDSYDSLAKLCSVVDLIPIRSLLRPPFLRRKPWPILTLQKGSLQAPGTKWCGPGTSAKNYEDLGKAVKTDSCCRDHDHCPLWIEAGQTKYNLTNNTPYVVSLCDCDRQFKDCLESAFKSEFEAFLIKITYFDVLFTQCFRETESTKHCVEYSESNSDRCSRYADSTEPVYTFDHVI